MDLIGLAMETEAHGVEFNVFGPVHAPVVDHALG